MSLFGIVNEDREDHDYCGTCKQFHIRGEDHDCYELPEAVEQVEKVHAD